MVSMCTSTSLPFKFRKSVLWHECTRIIWMDYLLQLFLHFLPPQGSSKHHILSTLGQTSPFLFDSSSSKLQGHLVASP